jgi:hypothetical protein
MLQRTVVKASKIEQKQGARSPSCASSGAWRQINALLAVILATVLMASPSLASGSNVRAEQNVPAQQVWHPKKEPANLQGLYGFKPAPEASEPAWPYNYCPGYLPGESLEDACPDESNGG